MKFETHAVHTGQEPDDLTGAVMSPIYATSTFVHVSPGRTKGYDYTRSSNPNFSRLESTLAALENARHATVFASGMAAITAIVSTLRSGDLVLAEENIYGCTYRLFDQVFEKFGVRVHYADLSNPDEYGLIGRLSPAMVWIESPTNPCLKVLDIKAISKRTATAGIPLVVDNTFASPYFQKPLDLGADLSVASTTKYISGHSDCLGGVVCCNSELWQERMNFARKAVGLHPSPFECFLVQRGVKTLALRMTRHEENALAFARFLDSCPQTEHVRYPFLESHPQVMLARQQMGGGSGIVTAEFRFSLERTATFLSRMKLFVLAESLGGVESLVCHPASMTHASVPPEERERVGVTDGLVRFSVGIEHIDDLIEDFEKALQT